MIFTGKMVEKKGLKLKCPVCRKETIYSVDNPFRPFCSEKCRLVDLGQWFEEDYTIQGERVFIAEDNQEN